ncbi:MAG: right-handed parallel beta-helix repeat-containing protein [Kiritimatiellia bacterium]
MRLPCIFLRFGLAMACTLFFWQSASLGQSAALTLHVAPNGNDTWSGFPAEPSVDNTDGPLATLERARLRVRELGAGQQRGSVTVLLRKGVYQQHQPLRFTPEDSGTAAAPVAYAAYPGEQPVISGGLLISGWVEEGPLWRAPAPRTLDGQTMRFSQLYINGERRTRARIPNRGSFFRSDGPVAQNKTRAFYYHEGDLRTWPGAQDALIVVYHSWETSIHRIRNIDEESRSVLLHEAAPWPFGRWERQQRYYVENLREALDEPGEWFLDPDRNVFLYYPLPGETPTNVNVVAPVLPATMLYFDGDLANKKYVEYLCFQGLTFRHTDANLKELRNPGQGEIYQPGLIQAEGLRHARFIGCEIANTGGHAIWLAAGCSNNLLQCCHLHDLGGGGVYIGGGWGVHEQHPASHNTVDNCLIRDGSYMFRGAHGVWIGKSSHNRVTHNEISNFDYTGISCGWSWRFAPSSANHNTLDHNYIHHFGNGEGLSDMGGIYTLGVSPGTTIRNNHIHDVYNYAHVSHGSGIYPDEGSTDILIEGNLVYRLRNSPLFMHYGKECTVRNNILALGGKGQLRRSREDKRCHYIAVGNIIYGGTNPHMLDGPWKNHDWQLGVNLYWSVDGRPDFAGMDFATWQPFGKDVGSKVADPLFVDPENNDFRLRPESPALAMGFRPIDPAQSGLYGDPSWTGLPRRFANRECREYDRPVDPPLRVYFDFEADPVGSAPIQGAIVSGENGASVLVANDHAAGGSQSLKFTDAPDQPHAWTPHLYYQTTYTQGVVRLIWEMRNSPESSAAFSVDLRQYDTGAPYRTGPSVAVAADGTLRASGQEIGRLPVGEWARISIELVLGPGAPDRYQLTFTVPDQAPIVRDLPYVDSTFHRIDWLGFSSLSTQAAIFHIDNLMLGTEAELRQQF